MREIRKLAEQVVGDAEGLVVITTLGGLPIGPSEREVKLARFTLEALPVIDALIVYVDMGGLEGDEDLPEAITLRELLRNLRSFR